MDSKNQLSYAEAGGYHGCACSQALSVLIIIMSHAADDQMGMSTVHVMNITMALRVFCVSGRSTSRLMTTLRERTCRLDRGLSVRVAVTDCLISGRRAFSPRRAYGGSSRGVPMLPNLRQSPRMRAIMSPGARLSRPPPIQPPAARLVCCALVGVIAVKEVLANCSSDSHAVRRRAMKLVMRPAVAKSAPCGVCLFPDGIMKGSDYACVAVRHPIWHVESVVAHSHVIIMFSCLQRPLPVHPRTTRIRSTAP
jgi:hypothetical protein